VATTTIVGSPDEAANRLFITHLAETSQYRIDTGVSADALTFLHPRSIAAQGSYLASGSFLGLVQAGALVYQLFGAGAERMLTPLLSLVGLVAMYFVFRRFWSRLWSLLGVVLMAFHPAFFEFATLPYLHNGAAVAGLMVAGWALLRLLERPTMWTAVLSGSTLGVALYFRPVEALWVVPAVTIVLVARKLWVALLIVGTMTIVMQLPWLLANQLVYGSFLSSGYTPSGVFVDGEGAAAIAQPAKILFTPPGGAWTWHWMSSAWWYFVLFLPSWSFMGTIALARYFKRKYVTWSKALKLSTLCLIGLFPLVYYGTWNLYPTTPASVNGALASYVRYWVPLYLMMVPGVIIVLRLLSRRWLVALGVVVMLGTQALTIWSHPVAGLSARRTANAKYQVIRDRVLSMTETNAEVFLGFVSGQEFAFGKDVENAVAGVDEFSTISDS
jgi:hypothetical protein